LGGWRVWRGWREWSDVVSEGAAGGREAASGGRLVESTGLTLDIS